MRVNRMKGTVNEVEWKRMKRGNNNEKNEGDCEKENHCLEGKISEREKK